MKYEDKQKATWSYIRPYRGERTWLTLAPVTKQSASAGWILDWDRPAATMLLTVKSTCTYCPSF